MFEKLEIFGMAAGLARHAVARQSAIAANVANADTPGYRARDVADFQSSWRAAHAESGMRASRAGHLDADAGTVAFRMIDRPGPSAPNGNTVSLETEMVKATEVRQHHEVALSIYKTSLDILRSSLGRGR